MKTSTYHELREPKCSNLLAFAVVAALLLGAASSAMADGDETLGTPSTAIAKGSGMATGGTGLLTQPGTINVTVPQGTIKQVIMYWEGVGTPYQGSQFGDNTAILNGSVEVTGELIGGGPIDSFGNKPLSGTFRADITGLNIIHPGANSISVSGLDFDSAHGGFANGAGIVVIYDNGGAADIQVRDGNDYAYRQNEVYPIAPFESTVKQDFTFSPSSEERTARLAIMASSVIGALSGDYRPNSIEITVGNETHKLSNLLYSQSGDEWDTLSLDVDIPAGVTNLSVQLFSRNDDPNDYYSIPASLVWNSVALSVPKPMDKSKCITITGKVYIDADLNLQINSKDVILVNAEVILCDSIGVPLMTCKTDADGKYCFSNLPPGKYTVKVKAEAGLLCNTLSTKALVCLTPGSITANAHLCLTKPGGLITTVTKLLGGLFGAVKVVTCCVIDAAGNLICL